MKRGVIIASMVLAAVLFVSAGTYAFAADACPKAKQDQAQSAARGIKSWQDAFGFFKQFAGCDQGDAGDAVGEAIEALLLKQWDKLPEASGLAAQDAAFEKFIVRHAGEAFSEDGAAEVIKKSSSACPAGSERLCKLIGAALKE